MISEKEDPSEEFTRQFWIDFNNRTLCTECGLMIAITRAGKDGSMELVRHSHSDMTTTKPGFNALITLPIEQSKQQR